MNKRRARFTKQLQICGVTLSFLSQITAMAMCSSGFETQNLK